MTRPPADYEERLLFILYRGRVEARALAGAGNPGVPQQVFDLADAMHNIPCFLAKPLEGMWDCIREDLRRYHAKWLSGSTDFVPYLDGREIPHWHRQ
jgi:hypothetical protein